MRRHGGRRPDDEAYGCSPRELAVLDLTDAGEEDAAVARRLGVEPHYVRKVRSQYSGSWRENNIVDAATRAASRRHAAALAATGKVYA